MSFPTQPSNLTIPTSHEPMAWDRIDAFSAWMDDQLRHLETEYADFVTRSSVHSSVHTGRDHRRGSDDFEGQW